MKPQRVTATPRECMLEARMGTGESGVGTEKMNHVNALNVSAQDVSSSNIKSSNCVCNLFTIVFICLRVLRGEWQT